MSTSPKPEAAELAEASPTQGAVATPIPLSYVSAGAGRRCPGLLTALGVTSITLGAFQIIVNVLVAGSQISAFANAWRSPPEFRRIYWSAEATVGQAILALLSVAAVGLAALLLWAGITTLRGRWSSRRLHLRWALWKTIVETVAVGVYLVVAAHIASEWRAYLQSTGDSRGAGRYERIPWSELAAAGAWLAMSLSYPIAIWVVLTRRAVKDWYARDAVGDGSPRDLG